MNETLIDRRRDMLAADHNDHKWEEIARITTIGTTTISLPPCSRLGFFIVGGGGSGHRDYGQARTGGNGGNGGCVNHFIVPYSTETCTVTVGKGGDTHSVAVNYSNLSNDGSPSSVTYNEITYTSDGGIGGRVWEKGENNPKQTNSGLGGSRIVQDENSYPWLSTHTSLDVNPEHPTWKGGKGEDGLPNLFDETDENLYGAGGSGGQNSYLQPYSAPRINGGIKGGGNGGSSYGDHSIENEGEAGTFYGAGGGGGSFSASHYRCYGGAGYQGIVIIYKK